MYDFDFGTGFSSLQYLHILPVNTNKARKYDFLIQKQIRSKILIVKYIKKKCQSLEYEVVAEGVETKERIFKM